MAIAPRSGLGRTSAYLRVVGRQGSRRTSRTLRQASAWIGREHGTRQSLLAGASRGQRAGRRRGLNRSNGARSGASLEPRKPTARAASRVAGEPRQCAPGRAWAYRACRDGSRQTSRPRRKRSRGPGRGQARSRGTHVARGPARSRCRSLRDELRRMPRLTPRPTSTSQPRLRSARHTRRAHARPPCRRGRPGDRGGEARGLWT
jgi:hypothetical protein